MIELELEKLLQGKGGGLDAQFSIQFKPGEFITVFGPSGAGKTTLIRMIAGLVKPDRGRIVVNGKVWYDSKRGIDLPAQKRRVGYMFQDYALFPNMTVQQNLTYPFRKPTVDDRKRVSELMEVMGIEELAHRKPSNLSGGQKQRVALARTLAGRPDILLLDEPLSALDPSMRHRLQSEILELQKRYNVTTLMVSHEVAEVYRMSNIVYILDRGRIVTRGTPEEIFTGQNVSGKFKLIGTVIKIERSDVLFLVTVLVGNTPVKVIATDSEVKEFYEGQEVVVASKAFNPMITPIHNKFN